jgi:hypothetical protein
MALEDVDVPQSPAWWMVQLARRMLDRNRLIRYATLECYRSGLPPLLHATESQRRAYYQFMSVSRTNFARTIVRGPAERMAIRSIRTAAASDENGDAVAWRYFTGSGLEVAQTDVHSDFLTFSEGYVRVAIGEDGRPIALRRDPLYTIAITDPLNPLRTLAAMELLWDDLMGVDYAYLWLPGEQWVASRPRSARPPALAVPGVTQSSRRWMRAGYLPRLSFDPGSFTMRPNVDDVPEDERNGGPYSETFESQVVPVVRFDNRDGVGEFEEHLDLLDRINHTVCQRVITAAIQAFKQRALQQKENEADKLPAKDPNTGNDINWDELFLPGPDALWKLPPGVTIWESAEVQLQPILSAAQDDIKWLSSVTSTPFPQLSPDGVNQSAEGAQGHREGQVFKVEDRDRIAARRWAQVVSLMFLFGPEEDRYAGEGDNKADRADAGSIIIDWTPAERFSLAEKAAADAANKSLSPDMAAAKIWGLSPDEVEINRAQRAAAALLTPAPSGSGSGSGAGS